MIGLGPAEATTVGAFGGSLAEEGIALITSWRARRLRNVEQFGLAVDQATSAALDDLLKNVSGDPTALELLAQTVEAAARSLDDWKIDLLARAFVDGLSSNETVDVSGVAIDVVRQLEVLHLHALARLPSVVYEPGKDDYLEARPVPDLVRPSDSVSIPGPDLSEVVHAVLGKLVTLGLAVQVERGTYGTIGVPAYMVTRLGDRVRRLLRERGSFLAEQHPA
ncbi:hypothetical protein HH310_40955 [Actinoplanes sp. TBRC 11911]|uniref:hypothetical protein n=1 Tax=Actinoplanes sp. TBRC 11911 TaxID=2729386 RepID=UPI00145E453E|nr:hypothetical protein [Actinoplanes sp. TBRC 11911]NMO57524.1 hypothetical protein [Actinoplanes sp. TBRC 11911]